MTPADALSATPSLPIDPSEEELAGPVTPVVGRERVAAIDVYRGVALLGILLMNILGFGMAWRGDVDLTPAGGVRPADLAYWGISHVLFEGKMRALFSILFGAGVVLLCVRAEARGAGLRLADIYYRRTLWLVAFGMAHAYLIWDGDILFDYGLAGLALFPFRDVRPSRLLALGVVLLAALMPKAYLGTVASRDLEDRAEAARVAVGEGRPLTVRERDAIQELDERRKDDRPSAEEVAAVVADYRGDYFRVFRRRARDVAEWESTGLYDGGFLDVAGMMFVGMGLMKLGLLSATGQRQTYLRLASLGYGIGIPLNLWTGYRIWSSGFDPDVAARAGIWYSADRLSIVLGHIGLIALLIRSGRLAGLTKLLAAAGRMALSNYLATSLACTLIFNGYGLGLYDRFRRADLLWIVALVWSLILIVSPIWLRQFRYGPMEWAWRSLTYGRVQRFRA